ncbi:MAG: hypothetical protein WAV55_00395 [Clostridiaceae bacterium]
MGGISIRLTSWFLIFVLMLAGAYSQGDTKGEMSVEETISISQKDPYFVQKSVIQAFARDLLSPDHHQLETTMAPILDEKIIEKFELLRISEKPVPKVDYATASQFAGYEASMAFEVDLVVDYKDQFKNYVTAEDGVKTYIITLVKIKDDPRWAICSMGF